MRRALGVIVLLAGVQACASESAYIPEYQANATLGGRTAATYAVASDKGKQGDVRMASYGIAKLRRNGEAIKAIHLRVAVTDFGHEPIVLDARLQQLKLPDGRSLAAGYIRSPRSAPPLIRVEPRSAQTVDLYFPIPQDLLEEKGPPTFDVVWRVNVGDDTVTKVTPFDKVAVDPAQARLEAAEEVREEIYLANPAGQPPVLGLPMGVGGW